MEFNTANAMFALHGAHLAPSSILALNASLQSNCKMCVTSNGKLAKKRESWQHAVEAAAVGNGFAVV